VLIEKLSELWKEKNLPYSYDVYYKVYGDDKVDVIISRVFSKWADLDWMGQLRVDYEAKHGAGSFTNFIKEFEASLNHVDRTVLEFMPKLSGRIPAIASK
jgi:hypothetical protein